ncbi:MAG: hypothetical protein H0W61_00920 [Bacteroidetes bacterium]|nr:hypothetical protein [Bacteroidota bacterium]
MHPLFNKPGRALKGVLLLIIIFFFQTHQSYSQSNDTLHPGKDSLRFYKKIKHFAQKNGFTRWLYNATFVDPEPRQEPVAPESTEEKKIVNPYIYYEHAIIRNIKITVYDPFGHSVNDTIYRRVNYSQRMGNLAHTKTRQYIINNRLLFHKNDTVNPLVISETERLLRSAIFVNDAKITIELTSSRDSVDVNVVVLDKWAITVPILITDVFANAKFRNQNLFGWGQQFEQYVGFTRPDVFDYHGYYAIDNLDNTYISSRLGYEVTPTGTNVGIAFNRGFFSPLTPWAGGLAVNNGWGYFAYTDAIDSTVKKFKTDVLSYDVWTGRAFKLSKEKSFFNQSTNIIAGWRNYRSQYINRPTQDMDPKHNVYNTTAFLGNVGFALQEYYKDKYIYRFGANEDVPEGMIIQYIYGGIKKQYDKIRYYSGIEVARAKHFKFGYVSATVAYGVFFNKSVSNDITANFNMYYFSNLKRSGRWFFRQFIYYNMVYGANKLFNETITLSGSELYGFSPGTLTGNTKMVVNSETVAYAPYKFIGFKFAPVLLAGFGMLGDPQHPVLQSSLYQGYALGIMFRNENLVSSTFQFSFGYYPFLPDGHNSVWKYNPVSSFTLRVRGFAVSSPGFIAY